jgi:hypothetical protein
LRAHSWCRDEVERLARAVGLKSIKLNLKLAEMEFQRSSPSLARPRGGTARAAKSSPRARWSPQPGRPPLHRGGAPSKPGGRPEHARRRRRAPRPARGPPDRASRLHQDARRPRRPRRRRRPHRSRGQLVKRAGARAAPADRRSVRPSVFGSLRRRSRLVSRPRISDRGLSCWLPSQDRRAESPPRLTHRRPRRRRVPRDHQGPSRRSSRDVATAAELTHAADHSSASYFRSQLLEYVRQIRELAGAPVRSDRLERVGWSAGPLEERP